MINSKGDVLLAAITLYGNVLMIAANCGFEFEEWNPTNDQNIRPLTIVGIFPVKENETQA